MISPCKKYTYILSLVCLSILTSSCSTASEMKHEISHQNQTQNASSNPAKLKNDDGFLITSRPYNSNAHLNCILSVQRMNCGSINLIDSVGLIKVYKFINQAMAIWSFSQKQELVFFLIVPPRQVKGKPQK